MRYASPFLINKLFLVFFKVKRSKGMLQECHVLTTEAEGFLKNNKAVLKSEIRDARKRPHSLFLFENAIGVGVILLGFLPIKDLKLRDTVEAEDDIARVGIFCFISALPAVWQPFSAWPPCSGPPR